MLNNLFSSFDMKNFIFMSFLFLNLFIFIIWSSLSKISNLNIFLKKMFVFFFNNINFSLFMISVFLIVLMLNFFSLNMFMFNLTSQINFNMIMIFMLWFPLVLMNFFKKNNSFLIHILPLGTSNLLIPMMILIELLSFFIRPLTLFLRLSINMIAGHVLVTLMSTMIIKSSIYFFFIMYMYMLMKFLVSFIQAYIITVLLNLYIEEI